MTESRRITKKRQEFLFYLALLGPAALWFSYVFAIDLIERHLDFILMAHIGWMVLSAIFCSVWIATKGLTDNIKWWVFLGSLFLFAPLQVLLHIIVFYAGCIPVAQVLSTI